MKLIRATVFLLLLSLNSVKAQQQRSAQTAKSSDLPLSTNRNQCAFTVSFSHSPFTVNAFQDVVFTDNTPGAIAWKWYIGNRLVSTSRTFVFQFKRSGHQNVVVYVSNGTCEASMGDKINVGEVCSRKTSRIKISSSESISLADVEEAAGNKWVFCGQVSSLANAGGGIIACVDESGQLKWSRKYYDSDSVRFKKILLFPDGNIAAAGNIYHPNGSSDGIVVKLDSLGHELWAKKTGQSGKNVRFESIGKIRSESIIITGSVTAAGVTNALVAKLNEQGDFMWQKEYAMPENTEAVQSVFSSWELFVVGNMTDPVRKKDVFVMQVDTANGSVHRIIQMDIGNLDNTALGAEFRDDWEFFDENPQQSVWPFYIPMKVYTDNSGGTYKAMVARRMECCNTYLGQQFDPDYIPEQIILEPSHLEGVVGLFRKNQNEFEFFQQNSGGGNEWSYTFRQQGKVDVRTILPLSDGTYIGGIDVTENSSTHIELIKTGLKGTMAGDDNCKGKTDTMFASAIKTIISETAWSTITNLSLISSDKPGSDYLLSTEVVCSGITCVPVPASLPKCNDYFVNNYYGLNTRFVDMQILDNDDIALSGWEDHGNTGFVLKGVQVMMNKKGEVKWAKKINSSAGNFRIFDEAIVENENLLLSGHFQSAYGLPGIPSIAGFCKMDRNGQVIWMKSFRSDEIGTGYNYVADAIRLADNSYMLLINCRYAPSPYYNGLIVLHVDTGGNVIWSKKVSINGNITFGNSLVEENGNVVIAALSPFSPFTYNLLSLVKLRQSDGRLEFVKTVRLEQFHSIELWDPIMEKRPGGGYNIIFNDHNNASLEQSGRLILAQLDTLANVTSFVFSEFPGANAKTWVHESENGIYGANYGHIVHEDMVFRLNDKGNNGFSRRISSNSGDYIIREKNNNLVLAGTLYNNNTYGSFLYKYNNEGYVEGCFNYERNGSFHIQKNPTVQMESALVDISAITVFADVNTPDTSDFTSAIIPGNLGVCQTNPPCTFTLQADKKEQCGLADRVTVKAVRNPGCISAAFWDWDKTAIREIETTDSTIVFQWLREDTTTVYLRTSKTCADSYSDSIRISWSRGDTIALGRDSIYCAAATFQPVRLNAGSGFSNYTWQDGSNNAAYIATQPGVYYVSALNSCALLVSDTIKLLKVAPLNINASKSNDIDCAFSSSQLSAVSGLSYSWLPLTGLNNGSIFNPVATPRQTTFYTVHVTDINGCTDSDTITVHVSNTSGSSILLPSAFTPNNDGLNDCFGIKNTGTFFEFSFSIFNRWGERIFYTNNPSACWDGIYRGVKQDTGVYVYMITSRSTCGKEFKKGIFTLIR